MSDILRAVVVAEAGARFSGLEGTIAAPMLGADGEVKGVIGVGKQSEHEFTVDEAANYCVSVGGSRNAGERDGSE